jgi:hypothetical protein
VRPRHSLAGILLNLPILIVLLTASSSSQAQDQDEAKAVKKAEERFTLAVLRRDAIAVPFATYDGKRWKNAWPAPESHLAAPIMMADVPKRWWSGRDPIAKWTLWPADSADGGSRSLETIGPTWFPAHCQQGLGLRTTYSSRDVLPPLNTQPYPKVGLAVAGDAAIRPVEILDVATSPLVGPLARALVETVDDKEMERVAGYIREGGGWKHPYTEAERKETPFRIEALYRVPGAVDGDKDAYYFEGIKHYAVRDPSAAAPSRGGEPGGGPGKEPCDLVTFVSGFLTGRQDEMLKDKERIKPQTPTVVVTSCDFAGASIMLPLGTVRVKDKTAWVVQWSGWTHEHYTVFEVQEKQVVTLLTTDGGFCPRR